MKRIFAAVKVQADPLLDQLLVHLKTTLAKDKIKWVEIENMHLTLKFFGETTDEKVTEIEDAMENVKPFVPFVIDFKGIGIFGSIYKPRVIFLGIKENKDLLKMGNEINSLIQPIGYQPDRQNFVPHLTLGRINFLNDKKYFQEIISSCKSFSPEPQQISAFHLYESKLKPGGPEYSILRSYNISN
jgi:RNA 2',3'-cyclic 3'-phosphodiesterase